MSARMKRIIIWTPRALCVLFAVFISLFALDVFSEGYSFWETVVALTMHLIPTAIILVALAVAWRWEWLGGLIFIGLGLFYVVMAWGEFDWLTYLLIAGPAFLVGILFLVNWRWHEQLHLRA